MKESEIVAAIESKVSSIPGSSYQEWYIGITNDPKRRRKEHEDEGKVTRYWNVWDAETEETAGKVEAYFIDKGMKGGTGGGDGSKYVYIF
jgi:hypothetical protein